MKSLGITKAAKHSKILIFGRGIEKEFMGGFVFKARGGDSIDEICGNQNTLNPRGDGKMG
jgi:hypothetical protein